MDTQRAQPSRRHPSKPAYGRPIPTKFRADDTEFLLQAKQDTGLPVSELVRRSVRLLKHHKASGRSYGFLLELV